MAQTIEYECIQDYHTAYGDYAAGQRITVQPEDAAFFDRHPEHFRHVKQMAQPPEDKMMRAPAEKKATGPDYEALTKAELVEIAKSMNVPYWYSMNKSELVEALRAVRNRG